MGKETERHLGTNVELALNRREGFFQIEQLV